MPCQKIPLGQETTGKGFANQEQCERCCPPENCLWCEYGGSWECEDEEGCTNAGGVFLPNGGNPDQTCGCFLFFEINDPNECFAAIVTGNCCDGDCKKPGSTCP